MGKIQMYRWGLTSFDQFSLSLGILSEGIRDIQRLPNNIKRTITKVNVQQNFFEW